MRARFFIAIFSILFSFGAFAYVPSADYVLGQWMRKIRRIKTLYVKQITTIYDDDYENGKVEVQEEIWITFSGCSKNELTLTGKGV